VGLATLGGTGGWYLLQKRLARPAAPTIALDAVAPPATPTSVNQKSALIFTGHLAAVNALAWSPHGSFIASAGADQTVQISNGDDGTPRPPFFTDHQSRTHVNPVRSVAWSPDGNLIASGDTDGNVYVWKTVGRKTIFIYRGHKGAVNALAWSPDGKTIASASSDSTVHVWQPS
jgi:WD40 repeat protein